MNVTTTTRTEIPPDVERWLQEAGEKRLTGSITLHFVNGDLRTWERKEMGRRLTPPPGQ